MANGRCRMHGGLSTGPRTPDGMARMIAAKTTHGRFAVSGAAERAAQLYIRTVIVRNHVLCTATRLRAYLPPVMAARLELGPSELRAPKHPSQVAFERSRAANPPGEVPPLGRDPRGRDPTGHDPMGRKPAGVTRRKAGAGRPSLDPSLAVRGRETERLAARAEVALRADWRSAIGFARMAKRVVRVVGRRMRKTRNDPMEGTLAGALVARAEDDDAARALGSCTLGEALAREMLVRRLRVELALRGEGTVRGLSRGGLAQGAGRDGGKRVASRPTRLSPTKAMALGSTTLARTWEPSTSATLAARFGDSASVGWQGKRLPLPGSAAMRSGGSAQQPHGEGAARELSAKCAEPATTLWGGVTLDADGGFRDEGGEWSGGVALPSPVSLRDTSSPTKRGRGEVGTTNPIRPPHAISAWRGARNGGYTPHVILSWRADDLG
jgi:hypothetical protein